MKIRILWMVISCLIVVALVLVSCKAAPEEEAVSPPKEGSQYGGHLHVGTHWIPTSLDPTTSTSGPDLVYYYSIVNPLVAFDLNAQVVSHRSLAESWEFPDADTLVLKLRKGVKFHDGTDFNSEAVKFAWERVLDPTTPSASAGTFAIIKEVEVVDNHTVKLHLEHPWSGWMSALASGGGCPISPTAVAKLGEEHVFKPVGTGPFKFSEWVPGNYLEVTKNEGYWGVDDAGNPLPYLDSITISNIPDMAVMSAAVESGKIDVGQIADKDLDKFEALDNISVYTLEGSGSRPHIYLNGTMPPMDNIHLRRALHFALNPDIMNKAVFYGRYVVAKGGPFPTNSWAHYESPYRPYYDVEKAREELLLGGYPNGFEMEVAVYSDPGIVECAEIAKEQWAAVGIKANLNVYDIGTAVGKVMLNEELPLLFGSCGGQTDPGRRAETFYSTLSTYKTGMAYASPGEGKDIDHLIAQLSSCTDRQDAPPLLAELGDITQGDVWEISLLYRNDYFAYWDKVRGWGDDSFHPYYLVVEDLWIQK